MGERLVRRGVYIVTSLRLVSPLCRLVSQDQGILGKKQLESTAVPSTRDGGSQAL